MRWKFEREDLPEYKCCFSCHVRTGTLVFGLLNLIGQVIWLGLFIAAMMNPEMVDNYVPKTPVSKLPPVGISNENEKLPFLEISPNEKLSPVGIISSQNDSSIINLPASPDNLQDWISVKNWSLEGMLAVVLLTVAWMGIVLCLIYGTIRGIAKYITPFFCVQMFDLCLTGLTMLSYFSDLPTVRRWISVQDDRFPFKQQLLTLDNDHLTLVTLIIFVGVLSVKAYFIGVVWTCYKYLKVYESMGQIGRLRLYDGDEVRPEDTELLLPPKYEDVLMMPPVQDGPAPPAYTPTTPAQQP